MILKSDGRILRTEPATNNVYDYRVNKGVENLPALQQAMSGIVDNYQNVQQDILETFVDCGQPQGLAAPAMQANGKRILRAEAPPSTTTRSYARAGSGPPIYTHPPWKCPVARRVSLFACIPRRTRSSHGGLLKAFAGDRKLPGEKRTEVDQLYQNVKDDLDQLLKAARLKIANAATTLLAEKQNRDPIDERSGRDYLREEP